MSGAAVSVIAADFDVRGCALDGLHLIEASAGTGKTWSLAALYLRLLLEKRLEVSQILVVTFTNAAAAELRERIRRRIAEARRVAQQLLNGNGAAGAADPVLAALLTQAITSGLERAELVARLDAALAAFDEAAIFTIHGFCQRALSQIPFSAGLPFRVDLLPDDSALRLEAVCDFWRRQVGADAGAELAAALIAAGDSPERWSALLKRRLARPLARLVWPDGVETAQPPQRERLHAVFEQARREWSGADRPLLEVLLEWRTRLDGKSYRVDSIDSAARAWTAYLTQTDPLCSIGRDEDRKRMRLFSADRIAAATRSGAPPSHPFFDAAHALIQERERVETALDLARLGLLRRMLDDCGTQLRRLKHERRVIAFDDLLRDLHAALSDSRQAPLAVALRARFPVALIDEFQDTDPLQFEIFRRIYAPQPPAGPLFLVGDPKQAIYSFRNADLHVYLSARQQASAQHTLRRNQRSSQVLIEACNRLFGANPQAFVLPGLSYEQVACGERARSALVDAADPDPAALRLWWLPPASDGSPIPQARARERVAAATAAEIARLLRDGRDGRITIGDAPLRPASVAVLVRTHAEGARMREALSALGIGSVELSQASIFESGDAEDLHRVLAAMLEPQRVPGLLAALATGHLGFDAGQLAEIAANESRLQCTIERFASYRDLWLARGFGVMLRRWLVDEGVDRRLLARGDGERRLTNLLHLGELLQQASTTMPAPDALLRWFAAARADAGASDETQLRLESDENLVQIVTIHKSKGLEYDVVFCPFLWDAPSPPRDSGDGCEYHDEEGRFVIDFRPDARTRPEVETVRRRERDAEWLRLAYVALTRAVHRCYLVAGVYLRSHGKGSSTREACSGLLNWLVCGAGFDHARWIAPACTPEQIEAGWRRFAAEAGECCSFSVLPDAAGAVAFRPAPPAPGSLAVRSPPALIPSGWRVGSFSSLALGARHESAVADHDARVLAAPAAAAAAETLAEDDFLRFPRGPSAGDCVHAAFERADFADRATWSAAVAEALRLHPQRLPGLNAADAERRLTAMLHRALDEVLSASLPQVGPLEALPARRRLIELGFCLPSSSLSAHALNQCLRGFGYRVPTLDFGRLDGYLKGFIDLAFERGGRWYLLDWKSNYLGHSPADYAAASVADAIASHGYALQYLLYTVALHRYLGRRLPGYDYERHFGGVFYLFVRGMRREWRAAAPESGVFHERPSFDVVDALDRLIGRGTEGDRDGRG